MCFYGQIFNGGPPYGHFRHQRLQININQSFVYRFFAIFRYNVFSRFLYSVNLTEYVAIDARVSVCLSVCLSVCVSVSSLKPKRVDRF